MMSTRLVQAAARSAFPRGAAGITPRLGPITTPWQARALSMDSIDDTHDTTSRHGDDVIETDVLVVGGGTVGASFAAVLGTAPQTQGLQVGIVEQHSISSTPMQDWSRQFSDQPPHIAAASLSAASVQFLDIIGAWEHIAATGRTGPFSDMFVWDSRGPGSISFSAQTVGGSTGDVLGHVAENPLVGSAVQEVLCQQDNLTIFDETTISHVTQPTHDDGNGGRFVTVTLSDGRVIRTRLLVGSDGANSPLANMLGLKSHGWSYQQSGVIGNIECEPFHTAFQRFLPTGPVALLPIYGPGPDNAHTCYASLVWTTTTREAQRLLDLDKEQFLRELVAAIHEPHSLDPLTTLAGAALRALPIVGPHLRDLGGQRSNGEHMGIPELYRVVGDIAARPLQLKHRLPYTAGRSVVIGDAAHVCHPLAGQGLNIGLSDAIVLASTLAEAVGSGSDIGGPITLSHYTRERLVHNSLMLGVTDTLQKLFGSTLPPIAAARNMGLTIVDALPPAKRLLANYAVGTHLQGHFTDFQAPL